MLDKDDLKQMNKDELLNNLALLQEKLRQLRFKAASGQLKQVHLISQVKKNIARIKTFLTKKRYDGEY